MPKLNGAVPRYRKHKATGQAVVTIDGRDNYLGKFGSKSSRLLYDRLIGEWLAAGRTSPPPQGEDFTVNELVLRFWRFAKAHYRRRDGSPTGTAVSFKPALKMLRELYGDVSVDEFGPLSLKRLQNLGIERGHSRRYINDNTHRIRRVFQYGVGEELVCESTYRRLTAVDGLAEGKTDAVEHPPVEPVDDEIVDRTITCLSSVVAAMVRLQRLTGARPVEVCNMRPSEIDRTDAVWFYRPATHKTERYSKKRLIAIGPRGQLALAPYIDREPSLPCFRPSDAIAEHHARKNARRTTPSGRGNEPGMLNGKPVSRRGRRDRDQYDTTTYRRAIHRGCERAFPPPEQISDEDLKAWQKEHRWNPNQLRHTAATEIRELFGIEEVAAILGHANIDTSEIYAEKSKKLIAAIALQAG